MAYENFIGQRYLMAKQRSKVVSIITLIAVGGVALGVTALIVVLSVMGGFTKDLTDNILGARAHIVIQDSEHQPLMNAADLAEEAEGVHEDIVGAAPFVESEVMVSSRTNLSGVILRGVDVDRVGGVNDLLDDLEEGQLEFLRDDEALEAYLEEHRSEQLDDLMRRLDRDEIPQPPQDAEPSAPEPSDPVMDPPDSDDAPELPQLDEDNPSPDNPSEEDNPQQDNPSEGEPGDLPPDPGGDDGAPALPQLDDEDADPVPVEDAPVDDVAADDGGPALVPMPEDGAMPPMFDDATEIRARVPGIIIGTELATALNVGMGDEIDVVTPRGEMGPTGPIPRSRPFRVVGIFYSGMYEYDANHAYTEFADAASLMDQRGATGVEVRTTDIDTAVPAAEALREAMEPGLDVLDWQELNSSLFFALRLERIAMFVVLTFIILVASFSIVAMLIMIVIEKAREIAIMKSMGATDGGIMRIFMYQGVVIGVLGASLGLVAGLGICWYLASIGLPLEALGVDPGVYYISKLPVEVNTVEVVAVVVCAILIAFLATLYPSYKAAQLNPVEGLRYD